MWAVWLICTARARLSDHCLLSSSLTDRYWYGRWQQGPSCEWWTTLATMNVRCCYIDEWCWMMCNIMCSKGWGEVVVGPPTPDNFYTLIMHQINFCACIALKLKTSWAIPLDKVLRLEKCIFFQEVQRMSIPIRQMRFLLFSVNINSTQLLFI